LIADIKNSAVRITENILFALNIFILFLFFFSDRIVVPVWLQPLGRMHPLLLHFPIVILLLALLLEFFSFRMKYTDEKFYQLFAESLLLIGTLTAAVTAIMGLILSKEQGYQGTAMQWHKVGGVSIVLVSSFIYYSRDAPWFKSWVLKTSCVLAVLCIIVASHLGSVLTHGENFVLAPVSGNDNKVVAFSEALVFRDVVRPIFIQKCVGCHNEKKQKGGLVLTDSAFIMRGGQTGILFDTTDTDLSLLLKRVHLPPEEKKHMPPSGRPQLTDDELNLLHSWIKRGHEFSKKLIDLPLNDSFRIFAAALFEGAGNEQFDFNAADQAEVRKLNNNYRLVEPIAQGSPALAASLFNRASYNQKSLHDLLAVKLQLIELNLNKLPVKDADLKIISEFQNLRRLNLNFTDITDAGVVQLSSLQHLRDLSISGTKVSSGAIRKIINQKELSSVAVWNTGITEKDIEQLRAVNPTIDFVSGYKDDGSDSAQLNPPMVRNAKDPGSVVFIDKSLLLHFSHPVRGVDIRYDINGNEPDSMHGVSFKHDSMITQDAVIRARAFKPGWIGSDVASFQFFKSSIQPDSVELLTKPSDDRKGSGAATFSNKIAGDFNGYSEKWIGYNHQDMEVKYRFNQPAEVSSMGLHLMMKTSDGVFPPQKIEVWGGDEKHMKLLAVTQPTQPGKKDRDTLKVIECDWKPLKVSCLKIVAMPTQKFPAWHKAAKNERPLLLVDEILLN
jgi:uncharacterized membrane protein